MSSKEQPIRTVGDIHGFYRTGTVRGVGNWSETHMSASSSGGGGQMYNGTGHVSAPTLRVSSSTTEVLRFFLEYGADDEDEMTVKGGGFAAREGQRVSVIRIGSRPNWGYSVAYHNHNTGSTHCPDRWLEWPLEDAPKKAMLLLAPIGAGILGAVIGGSTLALLAALGAFGWAAWDLSQKSGRRRELVAAIRARVAEVVAEAKADHARSRAGDGPALAVAE